MARVEQKIIVDLPIGTVYNQWTQFEEFPRFMEGVEEVRQLEPERLFWVAQIAGKHKEWYARITRQVQDRLIAWESESGTANSGTVIFKPTEEGKTEVELHIEYEPEDFQEVVGGALGFVSRRVEGDLKRFKEFIEERGMETGAWRGEILHGENRPVAPYQDAGDQPKEEQIRPGVSGMDVREILGSARPIDQEHR